MKNLDMRYRASVDFIQVCVKKVPDADVDIILDQMEWFEGLVWAIEDLVGQDLP